MDDKLTVKDIAALSTNVPIIIAVSSGPFTSLFNSYTMKNVENIFIVNDHYSNPKIINTTIEGLMIKYNMMETLLYNSLNYIIFFIVLILLAILYYFIDSKKGRNIVRFKKG